MLIWIDIITPKQVYFLGELSRRLEAKGHEVFRTTRTYREVNELLELKGMNAVKIGKHGGATLQGKLIAGAHRIAKLTKMIYKLKPDLAVSFSSPEAARTAFGLAIPHVTINDSPHSEAVAKLTIPLSKVLLAPKIIPIKVWKSFGATPETIVQYNALDPIAWLKFFLPDQAILSQLNLDPSKPIVVFRLEEAFASYLRGKTKVQESVAIPIIRELLEKYESPLQVVVLPRHTQQVVAMRTIFQNRVITPRKVVDGPSLLFFSWVFVGAGGTMTTEAALLGVPTISCYPAEPTIIERYLISQKLVSRITDPEKAVRKIIDFIKNIDEYRRMRQKVSRALAAEMEDPIEVIIQTMESLQNQT